MSSNRKLKKVIIEGFGLYKDRQVIDLTSIQEDTVVGIFGVNSDGEGGYDSNAAGKTTFTNAISWALFGMLPIQGESTRALTKEQIVNRESEKARVGLEYQIDNDLVYFESTITKSGTRKSTLIVNDEKFEANNPTQVRNKFYSILGISGGDKNNFIDFLNRCYFSGDITKSFASKNFSDRDRLKIVAKIKKLDVYDIAIDKCEKLSKSYRLKMNELEFKLQDKLNTFEKFTSLSQLEEFLEMLLEKLVSLNEEKDKIQAELEKLEKILKLKSELDSLKDEMIPTKRKIEIFIENVKNRCDRLNSLQKEYQEVNTAISKYPKQKENGNTKTELIVKIGLAKDEVNKLRSLRIEKTNLVKILNNEISDLKDNKYLTCPNCKVSLIHEHDDLQLVDKEKILKLIEEKNSKCDTIFEEIKTINIDIESQEKFIKELEKRKDDLIEQSTIIISLEKRQKEIEDKYEKAKEGLRESDVTEENGKIVPSLEVLELTNYADFQKLDSKIKAKELEIKEIGESKYEIRDLNLINEKINQEKMRVKDTEGQIELLKKYEKEIKEINREFKLEKENFKKYDYWKTGFKQLKNIELIETEPELENTVNRILNEIGTGIVVQFDVKVEEGELSINLIEDSGNELPLELFSTGQANRISFASGLALSELASESDISYGFSMWDEVLDGLDNTGQDMFYEVLRGLPGLKFVISHDKKLQGFFENKITVTRKNHSSKIELETKKCSK